MQLLFVSIIEEPFQTLELWIYIYQIKYASKCADNIHHQQQCCFQNERRCDKFDKWRKIVSPTRTIFLSHTYTCRCAIFHSHWFCFQIWSIWKEVWTRHSYSSVSNSTASWSGLQHRTVVPHKSARGRKHELGSLQSVKPSCCKMEGCIFLHTSKLWHLSFRCCAWAWHRKDWLAWSWSHRGHREPTS